MSTILDALRKVERERVSSLDQAAEVAPVVPEVRRRRNVPVVAVVTCALLGFGGGALVSWWLPEERQLEVGALPVPPPPAIPVPHAPLAANPLVPPKVESPDGAIALPNPPGAAVLPGQASGEVPAEVAVAVRPGEPPSVEASRPIVADRGPADAPSPLDTQVAALEPSPFSAPREATSESASASRSAKMTPPLGVRNEATTDEVAEDGLAALPRVAPTVPEVSPVEPAPQSEPEPETPAEKVVDTGRSPPGAPKVALSFLQWSAEPGRRFAFISIDGAPTQRVHEGEVAAGLTVAAITPTGVQFKREGTIFTIRPRH